MKIAAVMTTEVVAVGPLESLKEAAARLVEHNISGMPVVDRDARVIGVVSEADILMKERTPPKHSLVYATLHPDVVIDENMRLDARTVGEAMTIPAVTITAARAVSEAAQRMLDLGVNRLPVVDGDERLVGIVTRADLVRAFVRSDHELAREIREDVILRGLWLEPTQVTVAVHEGRVTLSGDAETKTNAELLPLLVERVPGVVSVQTNLQYGE